MLSIPINLGIQIFWFENGDMNPNTSDGSNQGQWNQMGINGNSQNPYNDFVSQRFLALANGAYK